MCFSTWGLMPLVLGPMTEEELQPVPWQEVARSSWTSWGCFGERPGEVPYGGPVHNPKRHKRDEEKSKECYSNPFPLSRQRQPSLKGTHDDQEGSVDGPLALQGQAKL